MLYDQVDYAGLAGSFGFDAKGVYREVENLMLFVHNYTKTGKKPFVCASFLWTRFSLL